MSSVFGSRVGTTAPYPMTNYPASNLFGPASLQPKGAKAENTVSAVPPHQVVVVLLAIVGVGILVYHMNYAK